MQNSNQYFISKFTNFEFEDAESLALEYLEDEGFGAIFRVDVTATMKEKLDIDFKKYVILGMCNPGLAHKAISAEDKIGVLMPCNVVIIEQPEGYVEVAAINPALFSQVIDNDQIECFANDVKLKIRNALNRF